ncbi:MAG: WecB/TagA/CpsF family glycosyltransferase [Acidobacteriota bacterium]
MKRNKILSINISTGKYKTFVDNIIDLSLKKRSSYVCVANVHMVIESCNNSDFADIVNGADIITPDGMPLVKMLKYLYGIEQDRVAGMDLFPDLLSEAEDQKISTFFYGSTKEVLDNVREKIKQKFPDLMVAGYYDPPFRSLSDEEENEIVKKINNSGASLIFVALGCPKQEIWMNRMKGRIEGVMVGVGGAFPVFAGITKRAPVWMQKASLEWLYRLIREPGRLWKRYFVTNSKFLYLSLLELVRMKVLKK